MRTYYKIAFLIISLAFLAGCQKTAFIESPFKLQSNDTQITTAVLEGMLSREELSNLNVHVETTNGVVVLSGYVKTIRQSDMSEDIARRTPGVKSVQNNIIVRK